MELEALQGAMELIQRNHPIMIVEAIKVDQAQLQAILAKLEYQIFRSGLNCLAVHKSDKTLTHIAQNKPVMMKTDQ